MYHLEPTNNARQSWVLFHRHQTWFLFLPRRGPQGTTSCQIKQTPRGMARPTGVPPATFAEERSVGSRVLDPLHGARDKLQIQDRAAAD